MTTVLHVRELMEEAGAIPMDLIRYGMAQGTAYSFSKNKVRRIDLDTIDLLCDFFTEKLGREIAPGDIMIRLKNTSGQFK